MTVPFDIFRVEAQGVRWLRSAATLEEAKAHVQEIALHFSGEYFILDQRTGDRTNMKFYSTDGS